MISFDRNILLHSQEDIVYVIKCSI